MKPLARLIILSFMLLGLPMLGVWLGGLPLERYLEFPPRTVYIQPAGFYLPITLLFAIFFLAWTLPFIIRFFKVPPPPVTTRREAGSRFLLWGWLGLILTAFSWWLAWTRQPWMAEIQIHTFTPLWLGFIIVVNALEVRVRGRCLMLDNPRGFFLLFPASAAFWWFFEYLNRFVQNWHYSGIGLDGLDYFLAVTLPFSTVLPAVISVRELLLSCRRFSFPFESFNPIKTRYPQAIAAVVLVLTGLSLLLLGLKPDYLFGSLWLSPLLIIVCLQKLMGEPTVFTSLDRGDWRLIAASALAALICGFFWEMWNYYSLARWTYSVPFVQAFHLFEMPLIGYGGYLPFGIECTVISNMILNLTDGKD